VGSEELDALLSGGLIVRVSSDVESGRADLETARAHLASAPLVAGTDAVGAFSLAYDAMRKVLVAHMRANGYRVRSGVGAHYQTGKYGLAALSGRGVDDALRAFDGLRSLRNRSEYRGALVKEADVEVAMSHAQAVLQVVAAELGE
jgi:hypothetical protein